MNGEFLAKSGTLGYKVKVIVEPVRGKTVITRAVNPCECAKNWFVMHKRFLRDGIKIFSGKQSQRSQLCRDAAVLEGFVCKGEREEKAGNVVNESVMPFNTLAITAEKGSAAYRIVNNRIRAHNRFKGLSLFLVYLCITCMQIMRIPERILKSMTFKF